MTTESKVQNDVWLLGAQTAIAACRISACGSRSAGHRIAQVCRRGRSHQIGSWHHRHEHRTILMIGFITGGVKEELTPYPALQESLRCHVS